MLEYSLIKQHRPRFNIRLPRRQELPLPRHHRGRPVAPGHGHAGQEAQGHPLLRPLRPRLRHPGDARPAPAHVPHPHLQRQQVRPPRAPRTALPALPHREVQGTVRGRDRRGRVRTAGRAPDRVPRRRHPVGRPPARAADAGGGRRPGVRAGGPPARPPGQRPQGHREADDRHREAGGPRRHRDGGRRAGDGGAGLLRAPGPGGRPQGLHPRHGGGCVARRAGRPGVGGALRRGRARSHPPPGPGSRRAVRRRRLPGVPVRAPRVQGVDPGAAAGRQAGPAGDRHAERPGGVRPPPAEAGVRPQRPGPSPYRPPGRVGPAGRAAAHRVLRHEPHPGVGLRRLDGCDGGRPAQEERLPPVPDQGRRPATTTSPPWRRCSPAASPP